MTQQNIFSPIAGCMRWGKWGANFSVIDYLSMIDQCLAQGITTFDHADIYGDYTTEKEFGDALRQQPHLRHNLQIVTKCGIQLVAENRPSHRIKSYNTSRQHIILSAENALRNFGTDYLDVLLIHRPDPLLNPYEVAEAITELKQCGKVREFGVSNFLPHQVNMLQQFVPIQYNQVEISIVHLQPFVNGVLDNCLQHNITPMAWAALGGGLLTDDAHPHYRSFIGTATELAEKYATGINQLLIAFLLMHPANIIPVVGTTKIERLLQAKEAAAIQLSREDWFMLFTAATGEEIA
jgi:predicted oxidoreductase